MTPNGPEGVDGVEGVDGPGVEDDPNGPGGPVRRADQARPADPGRAVDQAAPAAPADPVRAGDPAVPAAQDTAETFTALRPLLFSIAYRMLGTVSDAEDLVQESFVRYRRALRDGTEVQSPKAFLAAVVTRLAIDRQRSAQARRESYVGQWLPEPLLTDGPSGLARGGGVGAVGGADGLGSDPALHAEQADTLSMAFLLVLERLNPVERAVFLLHDVFDYGYDEVAEIVGKSEANCRQLAARARRHLAEEKPRFDASGRQKDELATRFFAAVGGGHVDQLVDMLATEAAVYGDGGGKVPQWSRPIVGAERAARLLAGVGDQMRPVGITIEPCEVNGQPGALVRAPDGKLVNVFVLDILAGQVVAVRSIINPDKLHHLGPVADVRALQQQRRATPPESTTGTPPESG